MLKSVGTLPAPSGSAEWTNESKRIRKELLNGVVFYGWPREWSTAALKFEDLGVIPGNGYQMRKLRYEIVLDLQSVAIVVRNNFR
jgi:hypothetical protein